MLKVALTGNIASGKSTVEKKLREDGFKVLDTDKVAHNLMKHKHVKDALIQAFDDQDILEKNELCRAKMAAIVFENKMYKERLEEILHPLVKEKVKKFFDVMEGKERVVFVAVPLLFEAKFEDIFNTIILVYTDDEIRIQRLMDRNYLTEESAKNRLSQQMSQDLKKPLCAHIVFNNGNLEELDSQVESVISSLYF